MKMQQHDLRLHAARARRLGYQEGVVSALLNLVLFALKLWVGMVAGSVAMIADAWHTLSDTFSSLIVIFGFWYTAKPGDREHPFGHGRAELIAALALGILLLCIGLGFLVDSYQQLVSYKTVTYETTALVVFLLSVVLKEGLAQYSFWAGRQVSSASLAADGWHHRSDAIASAVIVVGFLFGERFWWFDGMLGFAVSGLILHAAYGIFRETAGVLLGEQMSPELEEAVRRVVAEVVQMSYEPHHFHLHRYGDHREITFHLYLPGTLSLADAHALCNAIEERLRSEHGLEATIHTEPHPPEVTT